MPKPVFLPGTRILSKDLWPTVSTYAGKASHRRAAIAYCTEDKLKFRRGDILVCDASDGCIKAGSTSAHLLEVLLNRGVLLYSLSGLHAKVISLGNRAIIGSANMSMNADTGPRIEASLLSDSPQIVSQVESLIHQLVELATPLSQKEITRLSNLPVTKRIALNGKRPFGREIAESRGQVWLTSVYEMDEPETGAAKKELEASRVKAEAKVEHKKSLLGYYRIRNSYTFAKRAKVGDTVIEAFRVEYAELPQSVYRYITILQIDPGQKHSRIWVEHPRAADESEISWAKLLKLAEKAPLSFIPKRTSTRLLKPAEAERLFALWPKK